MNDKQLQFEVAGGAMSQCQLIEAFLKERPLEWVSLFTLYTISGSLAVATRISNLNKDYADSGHGRPFQNRTDTSTRPHKSWYRYAPTSE